MIRPTLALLAACLLVPAAALADEETDALAETMLGDEPVLERSKAAIQLGRRAPDLLARTVEDVIKKKREADRDVFVGAAVLTKVRHIRLLLVWAASSYDGAGAAFRDKIDNDHPMQSVRAIEAIGFLGDRDSVERLTTLVRSDHELIAIQAARALGRVGDKRLGKELAESALSLDSRMARLHLVWAIQDCLGSGRAAAGVFSRYTRKKGTLGFRAKQAIAVIDDELAEPQRYKVKLDEIRRCFARKGETDLPPIDGPSDQAEKVKQILVRMKTDTPDWFHLIAANARTITISGNERIIDHDRLTLNLRQRDMVRWDRDELYSYYLVRFATILFMGRMGEAKEGQRAWEPGILDAWQYAMDHAYEEIAVDEDPAKFLQQICSQRPPPW